MGAVSVLLLFSWRFDVCGVSNVGLLFFMCFARAAKVSPRGVLPNAWYFLSLAYVVFIIHTVCVVLFFLDFLFVRLFSFSSMFCLLATDQRLVGPVV